MRKFFLFLSVFLLFSFSDISLKKRTSDALYRYEFFTTDKVINPTQNRDYFWFKGGTIHNSEYGIGGALLHDEFLKFYHSNQLAEAGKFKNGLKEGYWKSWFKSGVLQSKTYWSEGQLDGSHYVYDHTGKLVETGRYKNNQKHGRWINFTNKDTLKYRRGELIIKKIKPVKDTLSQKDRKPGMFKRLFSKKAKKDEAITTSITNDQSASANPSIKKPGFFKRIFSKKQKGAEVKQQSVQPVSKPKKDNFLKRLFSKKEKPKTNGQGS